MSRQLAHFTPTGRHAAHAAGNCRQGAWRRTHRGCGAAGQRAGPQRTAASPARGGGCCGRRCRAQSAAARRGCSIHQGPRRLQQASISGLTPLCHILELGRQRYFVRDSSITALCKTCMQESAPGGYGLGGRNMCSLSVALRRRGTWGPQSCGERAGPLSEGLVVADGQSPVRRSTSRAWSPFVQKRFTSDVCARMHGALLASTKLGHDCMLVTLAVPRPPSAAAASHASSLPPHCNPQAVPPHRLQVARSHMPPAAAQLMALWRGGAHTTGSRSPCQTPASSAASGDRTPSFDVHSGIRSASSASPWHARLHVHDQAWHAGGTLLS
jgi:hypothetical protein